MKVSRDKGVDNVGAPVEIEEVNEASQADLGGRRCLGCKNEDEASGTNASAFEIESIAAPMYWICFIVVLLSTDLCL